MAIEDELLQSCPVSLLLDSYLKVKIGVKVRMGFVEIIIGSGPKRPRNPYARYRINIRVL